MLAYVLARLGLALLTLWLVSVTAFVLLRVAPGDAAVAALALSPGETSLSPEQLDRRRRELGLDRPYLVQYGRWVGDMLRLDAGRSAASGLPIVQEVGPRIGVTIELAVVTALLVTVVGGGLGLVSAAAGGKAADVTVRVIAHLGLAAPAFWIGLMLIIGLASWTGYFAASAYAPLLEDPWQNLRAVLPAALVLAVRPAALLARVVRASTAEALRQDFVRAARARGLGEATVLWRHAFRVAAPPVVTVIGVETLFLLGGAVLIEQVFGLPGVGRALVAGVIERDYPLVQFLLVIFGGFAVALNLVADLVYLRLDPRVAAR